MDGRSALGAPRATDEKQLSLSDVTPDGVTVLDPVDLPAGARALMLERTVASFLPAVGDPWRWWRLGPAPELVGVPVDDLPAGRLTRLDAVLLDPSAYEDVPAAGVLPALVRGRVPVAAAETPLAVAVNGVVAATSRSYVEGTDMSFGVMVDEALLRAGRNEITVYAIESPTG